MNGRMYDAKLGRFLSPDNYIQEPFSTQSFNRYGYVWNNPLKFTDPSGEFFWVAVIIGAVIGGTTAAIKGGNFGEILLGALIGGVAAGVGAGVANLVAGGAFFGSQALTVVGFWSGAAVGAASGFAAGFTGAAITSWASGHHFMTGFMRGLRGGIQGAFIGAAIGGVTAGIKANNNGRDFWSGDVKNPPQPIRLTPVGIKSLNPKIEMSTDIIDAKPTLNKTSSVSSIKSSATKAGLNIDDAIDTLNNNGLSKSSGYCARYVRKALEGGGLDTSGRPVYAKNYGNLLLKKGFDKISIDNYIPLRGDIAVFESFKGLRNHIYGHIQMFNGKQWVSDFFQKGFWAGSDYSKFKPSYSIFRW
ncbi:RHS repeat-associated core domain-containing protein [Polaribacter sp. HL-MS24]|uniref:RHS repeat-associated core domain-containing protein n=1 Tax=Polaribacter sp. HL-MS24 TaxID=3077735 RepID=UPI002935314E|nr:RHS repeat-associated core domain-containing protein [Polaribacter sp. HL-MS24]WOC41305.1 RHS repeat-associated core domain-containing protein [Polaribacter sp. HL-MS24]